jgi:hypothetical protein
VVDHRRFQLFSGKSSKAGKHRLRIDHGAWQRFATKWAMVFTNSSHGLPERVRLLLDHAKSTARWPRPLCRWKPTKGPSLRPLCPFARDRRASAPRRRPLVISSHGEPAPRRPRTPGMSPFDWSGLSPNAVMPGSEALMAHFVANRGHTPPRAGLARPSRRWYTSCQVIRGGGEHPSVTDGDVKKWGPFCRPGRTGDGGSLRDWPGDCQFAGS